MVVILPLNHLFVCSFITQIFNYPLYASEEFVVSKSEQVCGLMELIPREETRQ